MSYYVFCSCGVVEHRTGTRGNRSALCRDCQTRKANQLARKRRAAKLHIDGKVC